jgi:PAS domain S-box-containing protein
MSSSPENTANEIIPAALLYRTMFEQSPDGVLLIDTNGKIIDFNEAAHVQLGYTRDEFAGLSLSDIDPFETPEEIRASIEEVLSKGKAEFEVRHKTKNGEIRDVNVITKVISVRDGRLFLTIWRDISESKKTEEALRMHRQHLESLVEERSSELIQLNEELHEDIVRRSFVEREREKLISDLREALAKIKILTGLLPMCAWCKKVRDDKGYWQKVETYIQEHSEASFTHGICPDCLKKVDPETYRIEVEKGVEAGGKKVPERRQNARRPISQLISYSVYSVNIKDWKKSALDAVVEDFSEEGMCIRTGPPLSDDMLVLFVDELRMKTGIVMWKKSIGCESNLFRVGIKFIRDENKAS